MRREYVEKIHDGVPHVVAVADLAKKHSLSETKITKAVS